jgi:hypothetical protein
MEFLSTGETRHNVRESLLESELAIRHRKETGGGQKKGLGEIHQPFPYGKNSGV